MTKLIDLGIAAALLVTAVSPPHAVLSLIAEGIIAALCVVDASRRSPVGSS